MSQVTENNVNAAPAPMTPLREFWHYFKRNKGAVVGLAYVLIVILIAVFANFIAPYNPAEQFRDALLAPPVWQEGGSWAHILGTDDVGRDVLSRLMYGARLSLLVGCLVVVLSLVMGIILGLVAGYFGGLVDNIIMRVVDIMLALPSLLLALVLVAIFGPSIGNAALALTFVALPHYVRLTRAAVLVEVNRDYVTASRVAGAGAMRQMFVNIFPNCLAPLIVQASLGFSNAILDMAALGFLGMGAQPPTPEWGTMLSDVLQFAQSAWWVVTFPGLAIMGLIDYPGRVMAENLLFNGQDLKRISEKERRNLVGAEVAMIFQDPMTSLNPCYTVGFQIMEAIKVHQGGNKKTRRQRAIDLLNQVGIPDPASRLDVYPHQLSGGMSQRVMIAMAIACRPKLLIADEPTTALDVTIQAQIIELLLELQQKENMALVLITHDLALVAEAAHKIIVMYAGQVVETGAAQDIFRAPRHPYTQALLRALPEFAQDKARLASLPGVVPGKYDRPTGCLLNPRCPYATDRCRAEEPALNQLDDGRQSKCHYPLDDAGRPTL
ncbi:dipeptide ABC transporter ATP-binding protein [Salmonella enterica subsp. enterica serovar Javiana]|nr:hypothetical protein [Salmonella enterica subsp. enterica serovar Infantis]EDR6014836.1 dipeptide ABC transporter ATP-binding protein [Salmonella enterica subsp. enterica serovar Javiana]